MYCHDAAFGGFVHQGNAPERMHESVACLALAFACGLDPVENCMLICSFQSKEEKTGCAFVPPRASASAHGVQQLVATQGLVTAK